MESFNCLDLLQLANTQSSSVAPANEAVLQDSFFAAEKAAEMGPAQRFFAENSNVLESNAQVPGQEMDLVNFIPQLLDSDFAKELIAQDPEVINMLVQSIYAAQNKPTDTPVE